MRQTTGRLIIGAPDRAVRSLRSDNATEPLESFFARILLLQRHEDPPGTAVDLAVVDGFSKRPGKAVDRHTLLGERLRDHL